MGKVTYHGFYSSSDEIPEPTSILMGRNLRKNSEGPSKPPKASQQPQNRPPTAKAAKLVKAKKGFRLAGSG